MRRSTVLSLPVQLAFPGFTFWPGFPLGPTNPYSPGVVFTILHILSKLPMGPISLSFVQSREPLLKGKAQYN